MNSPFSKIFSAKNPIRKEDSNVKEPENPISDAERTGISDAEHHAISSHTDAHSVIINVDKEGNKIEPETPLKQGGYEGGGDIGAAYIPTASMYTNMFAKIGQAVIDVDARNKKKKQDDNFKEQYGNETWYGDTDSADYKKAYASHYGVQVPTIKTK